jgi:hypothetical protein
MRDELAIKMRTPRQTKGVYRGADPLKNQGDYRQKRGQECREYAPARR